MPDLETVDLVGVEILSVGGPVFGQGSPPEGDFWSEDDLRAMAAADSELGDEINPPGKIGHSDAQKLLGLTDGEMPAVGWVENVRFDEDSKKLLADFLKVPKKFADLVETGAYRTRSVELSRVTSQTTQKVYDWVVTGVAWLGGKLPAVKTLDDVIALYEERDLQLEARRYVIYEQPPDGTVVWDPDRGLNGIRSDLQEALNPAGLDGSNSLWVCDVSMDMVALVCQGYGDEDGWVVPFTFDADGEPVPAPSSDWIAAEKSWVSDADRSFAALVESRPGRKRGRADTRPEMPTATATYTDEQRRSFAEATGVALDTVTDEMLEAAGVKPEEPSTVPEPRANEADDRVRKLEQEHEALKKQLADEREDARLERRRSFIEDDLLHEGKVEPGQREHWEKLFDADETAARAAGATLQPNEELVREFGAEGEPLTEEQRELEEREYADEAANRLGLPKEAIL